LTFFSRGGLKVHFKQRVKEKPKGYQS